MPARLVVGLAVAVLMLAAGSMAAPAQAPRPNPSSSPIFQGQVLEVDHQEQRTEVSVYLQWAPQFSAVPRRLRFLVDGGTRFTPESGGLASLSPGDEVQIVAVPAPGESWRALEVVELDLD